MPTGHELLMKIATCCDAMAFQAGVPAIDLAGYTLSFLAAHPEHIERYMREGNELWIDETITAAGGCLSYRAVDENIRMPSDIRTNQQ